MGAFVVYILEWSACLLAFLLLYKMCFSGSTFHRFNRFYLLGIVVLSPLLPLIHIAPTEQMEPMAESCRTAIWVDESTLSSLSVSAALNVANEGLSAMEKSAMVLLVVYILYVLIQLVGWTKAAVKMLWFLHGKRRHRLGRWVWLVEHDAEYGPFSWMNFIVISSNEQGFGRRASIRHELSHILLLHHLDLLLLMACVIINPTCWIVMKEIKIVHEYEADDEVINHYRIQSRDYQRLLIMRTVGAEAYALASSFNLNIKKRIIMMKKKQSHWWRMTWIAVTLPLIGFSLMAFSKPKEALRAAVDNSVRIIEQPLAEAINESTTTTAEPPKAAEKPAPQQKKAEVKAGDTVKGCVKGATGPLAGAAVVEIDEYGRIVASAITDSNGNYAFKVKNPKNKIRISYVGLKTQTLEISGNQIDATMEANMKMENITVLARPDSIDRNAPRYKDDETSNNKDDSFFNIVEQAPSYPGGQGEIMKYLSTHLRYPAVAREMQAEGEIIVKFIIDKTGFVRSPQAVEANTQTPLITAEVAKAAKEGDEEAVEAVRNYNDAIEALKEEAIHVVRNMTRWEPGRQNGKRVETTYTLPVHFMLFRQD
jgi:outer membrane biosynthesis protein TonB